ncbi:MAG: hypothetical protein JWO54_837 [Candidatus Saccharibacteria bacterium]|nr:hypothetical protein [Candidatus Saccharibacteria bacterium]
MEFFWFILAVVFFLLYMSANSSLKKINKDTYDKAYLQGKKDLADEIHVELTKDTPTHSGIKKAIATIRKNYAEEEKALSFEIDTITGVDYSQAPTISTEVTDPQIYIAEPQVPERTKKQDNERNLNVLLYTASFLIVAAAAAFIASNLPPLARLAGLWLIISIFYIAGLVLHHKILYLRPAATAFIGTGLALIPFAGIALSQLGGVPGGVSWFITSIIGIVSYSIAALRLKSEVVTYLTIAFVLSLSVSSVATFSGPIVFYFVALIIASLIFHLLAHYDAKWIPDLFKLPITQTSQLLTPVTLIGSLLAYDSMTLASYQIVFWVATLYYGVLWLTERGLVYETIVRALASISLFVSVLAISDYSVTALLVYSLVISALQSAYSVIRVNLSNQRSRSFELTWLSIITAMLFLSTLWWFATEVAQVGMLMQVVLIATISLAAAFRFKNVYFMVPALIASILLPFIIGRWPENAFWSIQIVTWIFIVASVVSLGLSYSLRQRSAAVRGFIQASFWVYSAVAFFTGLLQLSTPAYIASTIGFTVTFMAASYVYRQLLIEIVSFIFIITAITLIFAQAAFPSEWMNVLVIGFTAIVYSAILMTHHFFGQIARRNLTLIAIMVIGGGLLLSLGQTDSVRQVVYFVALFYIAFSLIFRLRIKSAFMQSLFTITYIVYPFLLLIFAFSLGSGWVSAAFAVSAITYWISSYIEKGPVLMIFGNIAFVATIAALWSWLGFSNDWLMVGVAWIAGTVLYIAALIHTIYDTDPKRRYIHLVSVWVLLGLIVLFYIAADGSFGYAAAGALLAIAFTMAVEGILTNRKAVIETAVYTGTFALQRMVGLSDIEANIVLYGHWWAIIIFVVAVWVKGKSFQTRLVLATLFVTVSSGMMALLEGGPYQILFLFEHVALLVAGALLRTQWALWWGLVATALAVLYFLRSSLFLSLLFLGLTLLAIVIWRLVKANKNNN